MTTAEAKAWILETEASKHAWTLDKIHCHKPDYLLYIGGTEGHYVSIRDGLLTIGTYKGAYPHIGEACFMPIGRQKFDTFEQAVAFMSQKTDIQYFHDLMASHVIDEENLI